MSEVDKVLARVDAGLDESLERLFALLRIKSISADPHYKADCASAAQWCARTLTEIGIAAEVRETIGHPMVVGHYREAGEHAPHVLFYGHYDVQPVDPLALWDRDPFDPAVIDVGGEMQIKARGAEDDKGQLMTFVEAARAWLAETGKLPVNLTVLFEGEEESSSPSMLPFLQSHGEELKAEIALVCDTGMWDRQTPAITTALRGLVYEEVFNAPPIATSIQAPSAARRATLSTSFPKFWRSCATTTAGSPFGLLRRRARGQRRAESPVALAWHGRGGVPRRGRSFRAGGGKGL
jgi:acetylornithine deacetylase/succinyl-diaminopimelate desuccinylase-like protein